VDLGRELNLKEQMAQGLEHISSTHIFMTQFEEARQVAEEGLLLSREIGDRLHEAAILAMTMPAYHLRNGRLDEAYASAAEGTALATKIGSIYPIVYGHWMLGEISRLRGEYERALAHQQASLDASLPLENFMPFMTVQPLGAFGAIYVEISGKLVGRAAEHHQRALRLLDNPAGTFGGGTAWADVGHCALAVGNLAAAEEVFRKGLATPTMFMLLERPRYLVGLALVALAQSRPDDAADLVAQARAYAEERQMRHVYPLVALTEGRVSASRQRHDEALRAFHRAESLAKELGMRPTVWQAQAGAARALEALGRASEAEAKRSEARLLIDEIAALFQDVQLRSLYLEGALAQVK
jgi:tetratricopeptide (TPR) repeat protein